MILFPFGSVGEESVIIVFKIMFWFFVKTFELFFDYLFKNSYRQYYWMLKLCSFRIFDMGKICVEELYCIFFFHFSNKTYDHFQFYLQIFLENITSECLTVTLFFHFWSGKRGSGRHIVFQSSLLFNNSIICI